MLKGFAQKDKAYSSSIRWSMMMGLCILWLVLLQFIQESRLNSSIQTYISRPVQFQIRQRLGQNPQLSNRLKILALDDRTTAFLGDDELDLKDLALLMENIDRKRPKAIILDRLFTEAPKDPEKEKYLKRLANLRTPIYSGAYLHPIKITDRQELQLNPKHYQPQVYSAPLGNNHLPAFLEKTSGYPYGHDQAFYNAFRRVGHLDMTDDGSIYPFLRTKDGLLVPHIAFYAADSLIMRHEHLYANGIEVPITDEGMTFINHRPLRDYYINAKSLKSAIIRAREAQDERLIGEDDIVLILFNFYTGATGFFNGGPFGEVPGGLIVATIIDSVLQGSWLKPLNHGHWLIAYFGLLGAIFGAISGAIIFWIAIIFVVLIYFAYTVLMFSYADTVVPWVLPIASFLGSSLIFYAQKVVGSEIKKVQIEKDYYSEKALRLEEENQKIKLEERLNLGRAVQEILLPKKFIFDFANFHIGMRYSPAQEMSGDWLYIWQTSADERRLMIGDVVGKGPSAAIPVAVIVGILGECERLEMTPEETLRRVNRRLIELFQQQITSTCTMLVIRPNQSITFYNAGSPGWFVISGQKAEYLPLRSSPLGINEDIQIAIRDFNGKGDKIFLTFTDGYLEGSRGLRRLQKALSEIRTGAFSVEDLHQILDEVGANYRLEDDRSLLTVRAA